MNDKHILIYILLFILVQTVYINNHIKNYNIYS
jgi:hypothetical protein